MDAVGFVGTLGRTRLADRSLSCTWSGMGRQISLYEIVVRTWVANLKKVTSLLRYHMIRVADQVTLAKAYSDWAFVDFTSSVPKRIPVEVSQAFEIVPDEQ